MCFTLLVSGLLKDLSQEPECAQCGLHETGLIGIKTWRGQLGLYQALWKGWMLLNLLFHGFIRIIHSAHFRTSAAALPFASNDSIEVV